MKGSCLCCGLALDRAVRFVAIVDVLLGAASFGFLFVHVQKKQDGGQNQADLCYKVNYFYPKTYPCHHHNHGEDKQTLPTWLPIAFLVCAAIQCVTGFILLAAVSQKSRSVCRLWLYITGASCLFTGFLLRVYEMLIVSEFIHELEAERRQAFINHSCRRVLATPITPQRLPVQLQVPIQRPPVMSAVTNIILSNPAVPQPVQPPQYQNIHNVGSGVGVNSGVNVSQQQYSPPPYQYPNYNVSPLTPCSSSFYLPPSSPYVPTKEEEQPPPPYHIAIQCPPAKYF